MIKRTLLFFIPLFILLNIGITVVYKLDSKMGKAAVEIREAMYISNKCDLISLKIDGVVSDTLLLRSNHELLKIFNKRDEEYVQNQDLINDYLTFATERGSYDQVRILGVTGREILRINHKYGKSYVVPKNELQFKGKRSYFKRSIGLGNGEVSISPLDLNIEQGEVDKPLNPVIRFSTPISDTDGKTHGILVLNYHGSLLIDLIKASKAHPASKVMLVNPEGYWIVGDKPEDEWGFMLDSKKDITFSNRYPVAWKKISSSDSGQFYAGGELFTFSTLFPPLETFYFNDDSSLNSSKDYYAKVISHIGKSNVLDRWNYFSIYFVAILLLGMVSWVLVRIDLKN